MASSLKIVAALAVVLLAVACEPDVAAGSTWSSVFLTVDGEDAALVAGTSQFTAVSSPLSNTGGNTRVAIFDGAVSVDSTTCVTWVGQTAVAQPGVLARWNGTTGITITRNVYAAVYDVINVHEWDLSQPDGADRFALIGSVQLDGLDAPLPWRACLSTTGTMVTFKVWPTAMPEPVDGDPCCTGAATTSLIGEGRSGIYAGHVSAGQTLAFADLFTSG